MRDLSVMFFMLILVPISLFNTFCAYLLWGWVGLISIQSYIFGFMLSIPYGITFAAIAVFSILLKKDANRKNIKIDRTLIIFGLLAFQGLMSASFAYDGLARNWEIYTDLLKTLMFCFCMQLMLVSRSHIHAFVVMMVISVGFHGMIDGLKFVVSGGGHHAYGIPKFGDNNHYAVVLAMIMPLELYLYKYSQNKVIRMGFLGVFFVTLFAVVATGSRGGLISMTVLALWLVLTSRKKILGMVGIFICAAALIFAAPDSWKNRMDTIGAANEDSSFMGRVTAWKLSSAIALAHPLLGGGVRAVENRAVWSKFSDSPGLLGFINTDAASEKGNGKAAHSIYFEVMGDMGFSGLLIFLTMLINAILVGRQTKALAEKGGVRLRWAADLSNILIGVVLTYSVGGALLSAAYFELPYMIYALIAVLNRQVRQDLNDASIGVRAVS